MKWSRETNSWRYGEVFEELDYPHDLSHDLSERTVYIPSTSLCCYNQKRAITPSDHGVLAAESLTKDSLFAAIQQRLSGMSNIINYNKGRQRVYIDSHYVDNIDNNAVIINTHLCSHSEQELGVPT
jgi:hypothetical protein